MHIFRLWRKHVQSSKKISINLYEELCSRGIYCLYIEGEKWLCGWKMTKFTMWKKRKNHITITSKSHAHPHTMKKTHAKFHNNRYKTVRGVALTRGTNYLYIKGEKWLSSQCGKSDKNDLTIISKHMHILIPWKKNYAKFQNDWYKTVRGVAIARGTHCLYIEGEKWLSSQCRKSDKKCSNNYTQTTCTSSYHEENIAKFQNLQYKTVRGVALTRGLIVYILRVKND